jgi:hypothetical protein
MAVIDMRERSVRASGAPGGGCERPGFLRAPLLDAMCAFHLLLQRGTRVSREGCGDEGTFGSNRWRNGTSRSDRSQVSQCSLIDKLHPLILK